MYKLTLILLSGIEKKCYLEVGAHVFWPLDWVFDDKADQLEDTIGVEGWGPHIQFIQNASHRPKVSRVIIWFLFHKFRRHIKWSSLDRCQNHGLNTHCTGKPSRREKEKKNQPKFFSA